MDGDFLNEVKEGIENILSKKFKTSPQRKVVMYQDRMNFACPYCGDSSQSIYKKRGNLYFKDMGFHCYNCGTHTNYIRLMRDFNVDVSLESIGKIKKMSSDYAYTAKRRSSIDLGVLKALDKFAISRKKIRDTFGLCEISVAAPIYGYLKERCVLNKSINFMYNMAHNELYVLNLNKDNNIVGLQIRSFDKNKVKYRTYNLSKLYEKCGLELPFDKNDERVEMLDAMSIVYNIVFVDLSAPLYVFEGGIDSLFLPNSVAICGVKRSVEVIEELPNAMYFFDNDESGYKSTIQKMKDGKYVFLWDKFLKDKGIQKKVKDLNELIMLTVKEGIRLNFKDIGKYFSNDVLDIMQL